jgi:nucleoside-diphosphate-sugar epimerase
MTKPKILITGANGQIGQVLSVQLAKKYGKEQILRTDLAQNDDGLLPYKSLDVLDKSRMAQIVEQHQITQIYHLAALLSASGEKNIHKTWDINFNGLVHVLDVAKEFSVDRVFFPSSIAVYGSGFNKSFTAQNDFRNPSTMYGITKVAGESWGNYYWMKYGLDVRSIRYPGIIGYQSLPGGGTTDYAVDIFHEALKSEKYTCFLESATRLPMIYMDDAIRATIELMEASTENISVRTSYNLQGLSFTPAELAEEIRKHRPNFTIEYHPDFRQEIAAQWPEIMDDQLARNDWSWKPAFDLSEMTKDMILNLSKKYNKDYVEPN